MEQQTQQSNQQISQSLSADNKKRNGKKTIAILAIGVFIFVLGGIGILAWQKSSRESGEKIPIAEDQKGEEKQDERGKTNQEINSNFAGWHNFKNDKVGYTLSLPPQWWAKELSPEEKISSRDQEAGYTEITVVGPLESMSSFRTFDQASELKESFIIIAIPFAHTPYLSEISLEGFAVAYGLEDQQGAKPKTIDIDERRALEFIEYSNSINNGEVYPKDVITAIKSDAYFMFILGGRNFEGEAMDAIPLKAEEFLKLYEETIKKIQFSAVAASDDMLSNASISSEDWLIHSGPLQSERMGYSIKIAPDFSGTDSAPLYKEEFRAEAPGLQEWEATRLIISLSPRDRTSDVEERLLIADNDGPLGKEIYLEKEEIVFRKVKEVLVDDCKSSQWFGFGSNGILYITICLEEDRKTIITLWVDENLMLHESLPRLYKQQYDEMLLTFRFGS